MRYKRTTMLAPEAAFATVAVHFYPLISRLQLCMHSRKPLRNKGLDLFEKYPKACTLSTALHLNRATMSLNDRLSNGQAQSAAWIRGGIPATVKAPEQLR